MRDDDYVSSDDLIRKARSDLDGNRPSDRAEGSDGPTTVDDVQTADLVRPSDRIESPSSVAPRHESLSTRPPPPRYQPAAEPVGPAAEPRKRGGWVAMLVGIALVIPGLLTALTFVGGFIGGDSEVTENVLGFVILIGMTLVPGVLLIRWARRKRSRSSGSRY